MAKSNKEKGRKIKLIVVFVVIVATSFLGLAGAFQPAPPQSQSSLPAQAGPQSGNNQNYQTPAVATSSLPAANETASSSQSIGGINGNLK